MKIFIALAFLAGTRYQTEGSLKVIGTKNKKWTVQKSKNLTALLCCRNVKRG